MVDEINREYNMIVTEEQCRRANATLAARRKAGHEIYFARLWDYQEEVRNLMSDQQLKLRQFLVRFLEAIKDFPLVYVF